MKTILNLLNLLKGKTRPQPVSKPQAKARVFFVTEKTLPVEEPDDDAEQPSNGDGLNSVAEVANKLVHTLIDTVIEEVQEKEKEKENEFLDKVYAIFSTDRKSSLSFIKEAFDILFKLRLSANKKKQLFHILKCMIDTKVGLFYDSSIQVNVLTKLMEDALETDVYPTDSSFFDILKIEHNRPNENVQLAPVTPAPTPGSVPQGEPAPQSDLRVESGPESVPQEEPAPQQNNFSLMMIIKYLMQLLAALSPTQCMSGLFSSKGSTSNINSNYSTPSASTSKN